MFILLLIGKILNLNFFTYYYPLRDFYQNLVVDHSIIYVLNLC